MELNSTLQVKANLLKKGNRLIDLKVFVDFDGTISIKDIGDRLFEHFGTIQPYNSDFKSGKIDIYTYWKKVCSSLPDKFSKKDITRFSQEIEIDAYFKEFVNYLNELNILPIILSDGFREYIEPVLSKEGLGHLEVYSNYLEFGNEGVKPLFKYSRDGCKCKSAVCKRGMQSLLSDTDSIVVYIGDGYSDFCPAESSDIIFAKKSLAKWCNANSVPHYPYRSFYDVIRILDQKIKNGNLKSRNRAGVLRRNVFTSQ